MPRATRGFSLLEVTFALVICLIGCLGAIGAVIFTRQSMELDKQRLSAMNVARSYMEQVHAHINVSTAKVTLVDFNTPINTPDMQADVQVDYYPILNDGTVDWDAQVQYPSPTQPFYARVTVSWVPSGRFALLRGVDDDGQIKPQTVVMSSIVRKML